MFKRVHQRAKGGSDLGRIRESRFPCVWWERGCFERRIYGCPVEDSSVRKWEEICECGFWCPIDGQPEKKRRGELWRDSLERIREMRDERECGGMDCQGESVEREEKCVFSREKKSNPPPWVERGHPYLPPFLVQ
ncbi:TMV resistance protein N-like protein [Corchorus olitorius]|uniref:TMV resistance protein N-like protein n=1 Tax=Corchorus olitorius TaxID=93759 RepID=A0A1R3HEF1_9ROSI|nr:TMV resistance protein N-like protein [Corchorus olitorius]